MKTNGSSKGIFVRLMVASMLCATLAGCSNDMLETQPGVDPLVQGKAASGSIVYGFTVSPSASTLWVGDRLSFTGVVTLNDKPVKGLQIAVEDPIRQQSLSNAASTDANGRFTYYSENFRPARYNSKAGTFRFKFSAGKTVESSTVVVNLVSPVGAREVSVKNTKNKTYRVRLVVNDVAKGTSVVRPGQTITLFKDRGLETSRFITYVMDESGKDLWNAVYVWNQNYVAGSSTFLNPTYLNFNVKAISRIGDAQKSYTFHGAALKSLFSQVVTKEFRVGSQRFNMVNGTWIGINYAADATIAGPGCSTFLGVRLRCSLESASLSPGLQFSVGAGEGMAIGPFRFEPGPSIGCFVRVASVQSAVTTTGISASAQYNR